MSANVNGQTYTEAGTSGKATIQVPDLPTEEATFNIKLTAQGFADKNISVKVNVIISELPQSYETVSFVREDDNSEIPITDEGQEVSTAKSGGKLKFSSPTVEMATLTIDGNAITLTNKREYTHQITNITDGKIVEATMTHQNCKDTKIKFIIKKVNEGDIPLTLLNAKLYLLYRPNEFNKHKELVFNKNKEAEITLDKIPYSCLRLEMEFASKLQKREVIECKNNRGNPYGTDEGDEKGKFAGYVLSELSRGQITRFEQINDKVYTERLLVGFGGAEFKIKVTAENGKNETYTLKIKNENQKPYQDEAFSVANLYTFRSTFYGPTNGFLLPHYNKGPNVSGQSFNASGFDDFAYIDALGLLLLERNKEPFVFYYNLFDKDSDKCQFVQSLSVRSERASLLVCKLDPQGKCLDACVAFKHTLPLPLIAYCYNKPIRKIAKPTRNYVLGLQNKINRKFGTYDLPASMIFDHVFSYRIQARYYEENNKGAGEKPLTIAKHQKVALWDTGEVQPTWSPLLSGATGDDKDVFTFSPDSFMPQDVIKSVKHKIESSSGSGASFATLDGFADAEPKTNGRGDYILGTIKDNNKIHEFVDGKMYKVTVTVKYTDSNVQDEKFTYLLDYTTKADSPVDGPEPLSVGNSNADNDTQLFGVPFSFCKPETLSPFDKIDLKDIISSY